MSLQIELGESVKIHTCEHCGKETKSVQGFVYGDGDAHAVYLAELYTGHKDRLVCLAIGVGEWTDDSVPGQRQSLTLLVRPTEKEFTFSIQDKATSPWAESERWMGKMMDRAEALSSPLKDHFFHVADFVVLNDPRIHQYLSE